ncbi:MAG TPA: transglutaminase domain-containing protein [Anaeromyxobacteraceae bacterium]|nr:transglutaminase domain-containing protein [Anaeromyxobacteraceae bacterium]
MTALLLAAALAAATAAPRLPERADVRYRLELAGAAVGVARLSIACAGDACEVLWTSALRTPEEAGGGLVEREVRATTAPDGAARAIAVRVRADGAEHVSRQGAGAPPAGVAEILLSHVAEGERRCIPVQEEETGVVGQACARREGAWLRGRVLGEPLRFRAAPGQPAQEVEVEGQRARFVADPAAEVPARVKSLFGEAADVTPGELRWCGADREAEGGEAPPEVPRDFPGGASCRERTARYLAAAAARGLEGRHAVGAAFDGTSMVWHEWAELRVGGRWIAVDPSFGQAPARGARFTLARWTDGDAASRATAGKKVLRCWSRE